MRHLDDNQFRSTFSFLVPATTANVFLVLVGDRVEKLFAGYHVLNLNAKYGLPTPPSAETAAG